MSYAIIRIQKMTAGSVRGIQIHDQREKDYSHSNPDIDFEKSKDNYDLHSSSSHQNYNLKVKERIKELNLPKAVRKDAIVMTQCLVTSDKTFFDKLSKEQQQQFFKDSYDFIKERYGEKNIISANVHMDEKTPHMHVNFVPVTEDGRLCAKDLFKRGDLVKLHDDFHSYCNQKGYELERGQNTEEYKKHLNLEEYKLQSKKQGIEKTKAELDRLQELKTNVEVKIEKGPLGYNAKDVEELKSLVEAQRLENYNLKNTIQNQENKISTLENSLKTSQKKLEDMEIRVSELETLKNENRALEDYLRSNPKAMQELEKHMSFKKQVQTEGKALAELKEKYIHVSNVEKKHSEGLQTLKNLHNKTLSNLSVLNNIQEKLKGFDSELSKLQEQRQEVGKISFKNAFKGTERKMLDTSIDRLTDSVKQATENLQREYKITPGQIDDLRNKLQEKCVNLSETIKEHETAASEVKNIKAKTLDDYKYIKAKTDLYSEPYRNIVAEKIKHIDASYQVDRELNTLSKEDRQKIYDRLPDGMKDRFQKHIQVQTQRQNHTKNFDITR